jgi:tetratricopeptide (TPR) repeat protein
VAQVQMLPEIAVYFGVTIDQLFTMAPEKQMERIENRIYDQGMFDEAEERQLQQQLSAFAENPEHEGQARLLLTKLYNHQAEQYRLLAVRCGQEAVEKTDGDSDAVSELANAWGSYIPDWNVRNHHALIAWFSDYCRRHPQNRSALMWLLDNLIDDRRLTEARERLEQLAHIDHTFRTPMYRYLIAQAAGDGDEMEKQLAVLEDMAETEWCCATTLGDIYTQRQEYDKAVAWYRRGQELQPSPKYTDSAMSIAHICEIRGDREGAVAAYREQLRLMKDEWGIVSGEERDAVERAIRKLQ